MSDHDGTDSDQLQTVRGIMKGERTCMLTTVAANGAMHAHPMTTQDTEYDGDSWFILSADSDTARNIEADPSVNLSYAGSSAWLSIAGTGEFVQDDAKKDELWNPFAEAWFPGGRDDPNIRILRVRGAEAAYWDSPGRVAMTLSMVAAAVTKNPPSSGDSGQVDLSGS